ncbi:unnamed protein product [Polarella glacialis]|uniref:Uncharacterized protein n=1 Tax=Polarella glacialis TaxID=89957 RepID=A0A813K204_POLGL|nr:unnamed protein product [Polarella glacialis]
MRLRKHLLQRFLEDAERKKKELQNDGQGETVSSQLGTGLATGGAEKASAPPAIQKLLERTTGLNSVLRLRATSTKPGSDQHAVGQGLPSLTGVAPLEINPRSVSVTGGCPEERSEGQKKPSPDGLGILGGLSGFSNMLLATKRRRDQLRKQPLKTPLREDSHAHPTPSTSLMSVLEDDDKAKIKESAAAEGSLSHLSGKSQVDQRLLWESNGWGQASAGQDSINDSNADNPEDPFGQLKGWKKFRMKRILVSARRDSVGEIGLTEDMLRLAEEAAAPDKEKASSSKKKKESGQTATGKKIEKTEKQEAEESPSQKFGLLFGAEDPRKAIAKADAEEKPWKPVIPPVVPSLQRQLQNALLKGRILHGEFGLYLLRTFRKRLLQRYSGPVEAFVETTHTTGRAQLDQVLMSKDEFRALASHLAFTMPQCRMMLKKLSTLLPGAPRAMPETSSAPANEAEVEGLSRDDFTRLIRITLPLRSFRELRWRLLRQYGGLTSAFKAAAAGGRRLGRGAFSKLLEQVGAFASEADRFFARILPHNEIPLEGMQVTQRAFLLSLQHAEGLTAARRLIRLLTRELPPAGGPDSMQELALTLIIRLVPEDKEELGADIVKKDLGSKALHFQVLRQVVKPLGLSRAAADALFRLPSGLPAACRRKGQKVTIEDVALAAVAGLGCEAHSLSSRLHLFRPEGRPLVSEGLQTEEDISKEKEAETAWQDKLFHYVPLAQAYGGSAIGIAKRLKKRLTSAAEAGLWAMLEGKDHNVQESLAAIISCNKDWDRDWDREKVMKKHTDKLQARLEARLEAQSSQEPGSSADAASHDDGLGTADKIEGGLNIGAEVEEGEGSESDDTSEAESKSNESEEHVLVEEEEEGVETEEQLKESAESLAIEKHQKESKEDNLEKADDLKASSTKSVDKVDELKGSSQDNLEKVDELKDSSKESAEKADDSGMEKFVKQLSRFNREASKDKTEPVETEEEKQRKIEEEKARAEEEKKRITQEEQDKALSTLSGGSSVADVFWGLYCSMFAPSTLVVRMVGLASVEMWLYLAGYWLFGLRGRYCVGGASLATVSETAVDCSQKLKSHTSQAVRRTARLERFDNDQLDRATRSLQAVDLANKCPWHCMDPPQLGRSFHDLKDRGAGRG